MHVRQRENGMISLWLAAKMTITSWWSVMIFSFDGLVTMKESRVVAGKVRLSRGTEGATGSVHAIGSSIQFKGGAL